MSNEFSGLNPAITAIQDKQAEQAFIASMYIAAPKVALIAEGYLEPSDFYYESHQIIFKTLMEMLEEGIHTVDLVTLVPRLMATNALDKVGGIQYLVELGNVPFISDNAEHYAKQIKETSAKRQLYKLSRQITQGVVETKSSEELHEEVQKTLQQLDTGNKKSYSKLNDLLVPTLDDIQDKWANRGKLPGLQTGFRDLDLLTNGLKKDELIVIAARPAMGKTALALQIAEAIGRLDKQPVGIFSLEMSKEQLVFRLIGNMALIDISRMARGEINDNDFDSIVKQIPVISQLPLYIEDSFDGSLKSLVAKVRRMKRELNVGCIVIDYLQLLEGSGKKTNNREQEISEISRTLKKLARELGIPIIALSQLSREVEKQANKRPSLSHLRESGSIEQDADMVMFIYRDDYYNADSEKRGIAEIIIAKNRNGAVGTVEVGFIKEFTKFLPYDYGHRRSEPQRQVPPSNPYGQEVPFEPAINHALVENKSTNKEGQDDLPF